MRRYATAMLTEHQLRRWYRPIFRDIYVPKHYQPSLRDHTVGAWLWSRRRAIVAGVAAAALHGAAWVDADTPIELIAENARRNAVCSCATRHSMPTRSPGSLVCQSRR